MFEGIMGKEEEQAFKIVKVTKQEHWNKVYEQYYYFFKKYREIGWVNNIKLTWILFYNFHFPPPKFPEFLLHAF